ncbi:MAG: cache domain-containing protein, partial [Campylobacterota bacterium]|nr:cache domain-containing protein [Campylobacterota bacterium]
MEQRPNTRSLKLDIIKSIIFIFIGLLAMIIFIVFYVQNKSFEDYIVQSHSVIDKSIKHTVKYNKHHYSFLLKRLSDTTNIKQHIVDNNRDEIYKILKPKFDLLQKENKYLRTLTIIKPDGKSFLRVHTKEKFGDNLSAVRPMVREIIKSKKLISGYETGKHAVAYRVIAPIFYKKRYIGSIGVGINPNYFMEKVGEIVDEKGVLFINQENLKLYSNGSDIILKNYKLQTKLNKNELDILKHLEKDYNFKDDTIVKIDNKSYNLHTINIKGFDKSNYAKYIFIHDITNSITKQNIIKIFFLATILFFMGTILILIIFFINRFSKKADIFYNKAIDKIKFNKKYLKAVEDNSSNIIVSSLAKKLFSANERFFEFSGFDSV